MSKASTRPPRADRSGRMRFVADESCDHRVVTALRDAGHDVLAIAETSRGLPDRDVLVLARRERRVLITEDRDFGQLVFAGAQPDNVGVLYLRCPESARPGLPKAVLALVSRLADALPRSFVVWSPRRVRVRRL